MRLKLLLMCCFLLPACGYHLVGQGTSTMIPKGVTSASLHAVAGTKTKLLLAEFQQLWQQHEHLPTLAAEQASQHHVVLRIEQYHTQFSPIAFDSVGLAVQYRLQVSAVLNMYQSHALIWSSGITRVDANLLSGDDSSVMEAERERLTEQLYRQWARAALQRLQSGF